MSKKNTAAKRVLDGVQGRAQNVRIQGGCLVRLAKFQENRTSGRKGVRGAKVVIGMNAPRVMEDEDRQTPHLPVRNVKEMGKSRFERLAQNASGLVKSIKPMRE